MEVIGGISILDALFGIGVANIFNQLKPKADVSGDDSAKIKAAIDALEATAKAGIAKLRTMV